MEKDLEKKIFMICPVRDISQEEDIFLDNYASTLERKGFSVHYPKKHTPQEDPIGLNICSFNKKKIEEADEVHVYWTGKSEGSRFDLGMAFMEEKPIKLINKDKIQKTPHKSFENVLLALDSKYNL